MGRAARRGPVQYPRLVGVSHERGADPRRAKVRPSGDRRRVMSGSVASPPEPEVAEETIDSSVDESPTEVEADLDEVEIAQSTDGGPDEVVGDLLVRTDLFDEHVDDPLATAPFIVVPAEVADDLATTGAVDERTEAPAPKRRLTTFPRHRRPRVRRVTRVIRSIDPWTIFKLALVVNVVLYAAVLLSVVLLWNVAMATGTVDNVERFLESFGWDSFDFRGGELYHAAWISGLFLAVLATGLWVLAAVVFNLVTDLVGGVRVTVLEEEVVVHDSPSRRG